VNGQMSLGGAAQHGVGDAVLHGLSVLTRSGGEPNGCKLG